MDDTNTVRFLDKTSPPHILTLILLSGIGALAMNMFLPSLPAMAVYFDTDYAVMQLSVPLYLLFSAGLQLIIGPVSDNIGRRNVLLWGLVIFMVATVGCIYSPNTQIFLLCRCAQAIVAVTMVLSRAVVRDMFTQDKAASMIGYVTMGMAVVPMISPAIGGVLDQVFGWQATFWAMFAIGGIVLAVTWYDLGETSVASGKTMAQQFREYPELLTSPRFWGYSMAAACCSGAFFAYLGGAPFVGSEVFGMEPAELGLYFGAPAVGYFVGNFITARMATKVGVIGLGLMGHGIAQVSAEKGFKVTAGTPCWL
jgi:DHA1 family bicyclomycin/chloramphenicol resistance-like MFS transporter